MNSCTVDAIDMQKWLATQCITSRRGRGAYVMLVMRGNLKFENVNRVLNGMLVEKVPLNDARHSSRVQLTEERFYFLHWKVGLYFIG